MTSDTLANVRRYFALMTASGIDGIIALFTEDAVLGDMPALAICRKRGLT